MSDKFATELMKYNREDYLPKEIKTPAAKEFLKEFNPPSWLLKKVKQLESSSYDMDHIEMIGLIGRLTSHNKKESPASRARDWTKILSEEDTNRIWNFIDDEVETCIQWLSNNMIHPYNLSEIQTFCETREKIACLNWVLEMAQEPYDLLSFLDRQAKQKNISPPYTHHLNAVGKLEPLSWWGYQEEK